MAPFIFLHPGNDDDSGAEELTNVEKRARTKQTF